MFRVVFCMEMSQRPSTGFRITSMMISLFLNARSVDLFKYTSHLSSQNYLIEIRELLFRFRRIMAMDTFVVTWDDSGSTADFVDDISSPFGRRSDGPELS